jgi:hypothetical protein
MLKNFHQKAHLARRQVLSKQNLRNILERNFIEIDMEVEQQSEQERLGYRALWRAVLLQVVQDYKNASPKNRRRQLLWFDQTNEDFRDICEHADIAPEKILQLVNDIS